jgi:trigger factor
MKSTLNKKDDVNGTIVIELEKTDYQEKVDKSLNQLRQKASLPGFRQGKVPKSVFGRMYGKAILADEINKIVSEELSSFIRENNLKILGEPISDTSDEKKADLDKDEILAFYFDVALTPEFDLILDKNTELTYYRVKLEEDLLEKQLDAYKQNYGTYVSIDGEDGEAKDTDLFKGRLTELEEGRDKENGQVIENAVLMPSYVKDEAVKNRFIGAKVGDSVIFNPKRAYDNNEAEVASLLQTTKDHVKDINTDFRFDISEVTRYQEAELNQELFDRILGEGVVSSEEEFRTRIAEELGNQFKPDADHLFMHEVREIIVEKMKDVQFPDEFLKRWLLLSREERSAGQIEEEYPQILEDLKFHIAKQKIVEANDIKVEFQDIEALATEVAKAQFAQYGMTNLPADVLQNYTRSMLEKEETIQNLYERATEDKIIDWLKEHVTVIEKEISSKDFNEMMHDHSHVHGEHTSEPADEATSDNAMSEAEVAAGEHAPKETEKPAE